MELRSFVGRSRVLLVEGLVDLWENLVQVRSPCWVSLEAPSGWGKTRVAREFYARLAATQEKPGYWPPAIDSPDRKATQPGVFRRLGGSIPGYFWWGISCSVRPTGQPTHALRQDLAQLESHAPYLEVAWKQRTSPGKRFAGKVRDRDLVEKVTLDLTSLALPPGVVSVAGWVLEAVRALRLERSVIRERSLVGGDDRIDIVDGVVSLLSRLTNTGLPVVLLVEDFHSSDEGVFELIQKLLGLDRPIMVITTTWPDRVESMKELLELLTFYEEKEVVHRVKSDRETGAPVP